MKKIIKILSLALFLMFTTAILAQPPDPDDDPNSDGGQELGGSAPIASGMLLLSLFGGIYATGRIYSLKKREKNKAG